MQQLHFAADVRPSTEVEVPKAEVKPAEMKLARQLIEQQTSEAFDPAAYTDEHRGRIEAAIQKKVEGQEISVSEIAPEGGGKVIDLMEALRASLEKTEAAKDVGRQARPAQGRQARRATCQDRPQGQSPVTRPESQMQSYSVRDVERVLRLSRSTIRGLIDVGFVTPTRGPRREYRFSFQDLIVLRAARALIQAKVSRRRIRRSLEDLREHLPETMPLSGLSICAVGDRVVVRDGKSHCQVDNGQYVLGLDVSVEDGVLRVVERKEEAAAAAVKPRAQTRGLVRAKRWSWKSTDLRAARRPTSAP